MNPPDEAADHRDFTGGFCDCRLVIFPLVQIVCIGKALSVTKKGTVAVPMLRPIFSVRAAG
jgi:hypothetical protein